MKKRIPYMTFFLLIIGMIASQLVFAEIIPSDNEIIIDILFRKLILKKNDKIVKEYPVAVGRPSSQTPIGSFKVINKAIDPYYKKLDIPGGSPYNPLGTRWIGFKFHYGIHGNSNPDSISTFASAGCVRMYERDVQELYKAIDMNTPVTIVYDPIKIMKDIYGENELIVTQPDYYYQIANLKGDIIDSLKNLGLYTGFEKETMNTLFSTAKKKKTIFANNWTFFINSKYITNDILMMDKKLYINKRSLEDFFNIYIYSINNEDYCYFMRHKIQEREIDEKKYIMLDDVKDILGGNYEVDSISQSVEFTNNYLFINGKLVLGEVIDLINEPKVPLMSIANALDINVDIKRNNIKLVIDDNEEIDCVFHNEEPYIDLKKIADFLEISMDTFTIDNHIEINVDPLIIYEDRVYKGIRVDNEVYIPYNIFITKSENNIENINDELSAFQEGNLKYFNDIGYLKLNDVKNIVDINSDEFHRKIYLKSRNY